MLRNIIYFLIAYMIQLQSSNHSPDSFHTSEMQRAFVLSGRGGFNGYMQTATYTP